MCCKNHAPTSIGGAAISDFKRDTSGGGGGGGGGGGVSKIYSIRLELQFFAMRSLERVNAISIIWCA